MPASLCLTKHNDGNILFWLLIISKWYLNLLFFSAVQLIQVHFLRFLTITCDQSDKILRHRNTYFVSSLLGSRHTALTATTMITKTTLHGWNSAVYHQVTFQCCQSEDFIIMSFVPPVWVWHGSAQVPLNKAMTAPVKHLTSVSECRSRQI